MDRLIDRVAMLMSVAAGLVLCFVVALTFYDVILRYLFSAPLRGRQDMVEMGMVVSLMLATPYTWRIAGHISVDLYEAIPIRALEVLRQLVVKLLVAGVFALIAWRSVEAAEDAALFGEATNMILIPHLSFIRLITAIGALHALIVLYETCSDLRASCSGRQDAGA